MPAQLLRRVRSRQPSASVKVDFANPITRGLVHASVPGVFGGKSPNLASTNFSTLYGSASRLATSLGVGANISGVASSRVSYQSPVTSGNMTLFCVAKPTAIGSACFLGVFNFGNAVAVGNYLSIEAGPVYGAVSTDSANWQIASGRAPVAGETVAIAGSFTASGGRTIYINGVAGNTNATARNPSGLNEINEGCYYGGTGAGYVSPLTGSVVLSLVFNRVLSAAEHKSLTENPWQVFAPEAVPLFWSGAAVGRTATASLSAAIRSGQSMTASASAVISVANTATVSASAAIRADHSATASVSAAIRSDRTASASLNAAIQSAATASATLSGAIQTAQSATSGLAAYIVASSARSESAVLSAAISDARTATSSLSAAVAAARTATATLDSAVQIEATASTGVSAAIREAVSLSANLSGAVQASATASASLAAVVAKTNALSSGLSAAVRAEQTAFAALSAYVAADVVLTQAEVDMLTDIWQRFGLDPLAPLTETETSASFGGIVLSKSGTNTITSTRSGDSAAGIASSMILDVWQRLGLDPDNPMTASETQISAGTLSQARAVSGAAVTVTRTP